MSSTQPDGAKPEAATVGLLANPMSGRDVRRLAARASTTTPEIKRDQVARAAIGAIAGGAARLLVMREPFRISVSAVENLDLDARIDVLEVGAELGAELRSEAPPVAPAATAARKSPAKPLRSPLGMPIDPP